MAAPFKPIVVETPGTGVLFFRYQEAGSKRPTLIGGANLGGVQYELAGWEKTSKAGRSYVYLTLKPAETEDSAENQPPESRTPRKLRLLRDKKNG